MKYLVHNLKIILCLNLIIGLNLSQISHSISSNNPKIIHREKENITPTFIERIKTRARVNDEDYDKAVL